MKHCNFYYARSILHVTLNASITFFGISFSNLAPHNANISKAWHSVFSWTSVSRTLIKWSETRFNNSFKFSVTMLKLKFPAACKTLTLWSTTVSLPADPWKTANVFLISSPTILESFICSDNLLQASVASNLAWSSFDNKLAKTKSPSKTRNQ